MEIVRVRYDKDSVTETKKTSEICYMCSACSLFCPITLFVPKYDIKDSFIVKLFLDKNNWKERANDVWMCCCCEKCLMVCPQDGDPVHVFNNLKQMSYREGLAPASIYGLVKQLLQTGWAYQISPATNRARTKLGLAEIADKADVAEKLKKLADKTKLEVKGGS